MRLFMVELEVRDWSEGVSWFHETLGLELILRDEAHRFALLGRSGVHLAVKQGVERPQNPIRLIFQIDDIEAERVRLLAAGVEVSPLQVNDTEGYFEVRLSGPAGIRICLFQFLPDAPFLRLNQAATGSSDSSSSSDRPAQ